MEPVTVLTDRSRWVHGTDFRQQMMFLDTVTYLPDDILAKLGAHLDAEGYNDIRITTFGKADPVVTPMHDPFVRRIAALAESFSGERPSVTPIAGGTLPLLGALRRFVGVPGLCAPGNATYWASGAHAPNEHIRLSDLARAVRFNCHMFQSLGGAT